MRRKRFRTICENIEWLECPDDYGLVLPSKRLFSPNLSKSAPCGCCACRYCITINDTCGNHIEGATVTLTSGGTDYSSTTDSSGNCCVNIPGTGSYTRTISACGYTTQTTGVTVSVCPTNATAVQLSSDCAASPCTPAAGVAGQPFFVSGGGGAGMSGITITITGAGGGVGTTDSSGNVMIKLLTGCSYTYSASGTGINTATGSGTASCSPSTKTITPTADSSHVILDCCANPVPQTLYVTDSIGSCTMNWVSAANAWNGCYITPTSSSIPCDFAGGCSSTGSHGRPDCGTAIGYKMICSTTFKLTQSYTACGPSPANVAGCGVCNFSNNPAVSNTCYFTPGSNIPSESADLTSLVCSAGTLSGEATYTNANNYNSPALGTVVVSS